MLKATRNGRAAAILPPAPDTATAAAMTDITLRSARVDDAVALATLKRDTFRETFLEEGFAIPYPAPDLAIFEQASYAPEVVARDLADPAKATWVAERDGRFVGYAHVGPCKLPHPDVKPSDGELYQLYVLRGAQGLRLGAELLTLALGHLSGRGPVWLGVWSGNQKAQAFYAARGFVEVGQYRFPVGTWFDEELIFRRD